MGMPGTGIKRLTVVAIAAWLLVLAGAAPAQAATKTRYYEDRTIDGGGGDIRLNVTYKNKKRGGRYTPRILTLLYVEILPVTCNPGGDRFVAMIQPTAIKFKKGKFVFPIQDDDFDGEARGKSIKKGKKIDGTLEIFDFDPSPEVQNCTTNGPRIFHAGQCRQPNQDKKLPICRF
jgi:hypothetical protein